MMGNHEEMVLKWLKGEEDNELWRFHGGQSTVDIYQNVSEEKKQKHIQFLSELREYYIDDNNRLFIHAGFTNLKGVEFEYFKGSFVFGNLCGKKVVCLNGRLHYYEGHSM